MRIGLLLLSSALISLPLASQGEIRETRLGSLNLIVRDRFDRIVETGLVGVGPNATTNPSQFEWIDHADMIPTTKALPFTRFGSIQQIGDRDFLVSGNTVDGQGVPTKGYIVVLRLVPGATKSISILASTEYTSFDAYSTTWNALESRLYVLDSMNKRLLYAPWSGVGTTTVLPTEQTFLAALDSTRLDMLKLAVHWESHVPEGKLGVVLTGGRSPGTWIRPEAANWKHSKYVITSGSAWGVRAIMRVPTKGQMSILGDGAYMIRDSAQQIVATGQATAGAWMQIACPTVFDDQPGLEYTISGGALASRKFRPTVRYGIPVSNSAFTMSAGILLPGKCVVGNIDFGLGYGIKRSDSSQQTQVWNVSLWVAMRDSSTGVDPVTMVGNTAILQPTAVYDSLLQVPAGITTMFPAVQFPVPTDASLEYSVLLWQIVVVGPNQSLAASDVFGSTVFPLGATSAAQQMLASKQKKRNLVVDLRKVLGLKGKRLSATQLSATKVLTDALVKQARANSKRKSK